MEVASAYVTLMPSAKGFGKRAESLMNGELGSTGEKQGRGIGSRLASGMGKTLKVGAVGVAAAAGGLAATALAKGFTRLQGIEQAESKLTGLGHSAESVAKIMENATAAVTGTAYGLDSAATVAASAVAAGVKPGKELERTLTLVGDAATIAGTDMESMGAIFNKVAASDMIQGDVLAQLGDQGIPILQLLGEEMGVAATEVRKLASQGEIDFETFQRAMEGGLGGAAQESGKTFAGSLANVNAALGRLGARVLGGVFSKMPAVFQNLGTQIDKLGPVADRVGAALGSGFAAIATAARQVASVAGPVMQRIGEGFASLQPALETAAGTFSEVILPAVMALAQYVGGSLAPVFQQVAQIFTGQVLPILASLGQFLYGTIYPAIVGVATAVGSNLRPVFDQLASTLSTKVLPIVSMLLERLQEWGPTIGKVVGFLVKIIGKVLEFAAAVLGTLLPPLIRFAAFMAGTVVKAVVAVIGVIAQIVASAISMGRAFVDRVRDVAQFVSGLKQKFNDAMNFVRGIPGKILGAFAGFGSLLYNKGKELIQGLIDGISAMVGKVKDAIGKVTGTIGRFLPGSPVKEGPLRSWNRGGAGKRLMAMLAEGISKGGPAVERAIEKVTAKIAKQVDKWKGLRDAARDFSRSVADAFRPDVMGGGLLEMQATLNDSLRDLQRLPALTRKLGRNLGKGFFSDLMQSGNFGLIAEMGALSPAELRQLNRQWNQVQRRSAQVGKIAARQAGYTAAERDQLNVLRAIERGTRGVADETKKVRLALPAAVRARNAKART